MDFFNIFNVPSYRALGEWKLSLPRCWDSPTFNLDALLYNCRYFWRYNPPMPKISSGSSQMICAESNPAIDKYWAQRFRLFSRFDSGIQVDCNSLFSATPEVIAAHQAKRIYRIFSPAPQKKINHTVLDIFCGTGSNAIQFALRGFRVIAIESDPIRISMAAHNSEIYGVRHLIEFVCEDYFSWAWKQVHSRIISQSDLSENTMYVAALMSPPWGGPSYLEQESFNLSGIQFQNSNANLWCALYLALVLTNGNVALFLPRNTNVADFLEISVKCIKEIKMKSLDIEFELDLINFKSKALTVYFGALANANIRIAANVEINLSEESDYCN
ncbi:Trimethylguanosine synthase [Schistosoma japonicum]|nr:Trimethylguanosine synthase [Schistosoma japonicum]KAH8850464.1 Trimethylguanosine synthase [Schistosoma japonicum]KAH8850465.1 Trimethylguanosine synthase [Schistosoma japonicum]KAH8850466.1 Trimethylguanosine synthase [Schistosoma japonicum]